MGRGLLDLKVASGVFTLVWMRMKRQDPGPRTSKRAIERVVKIGMRDLAESGRVRRSVKGPSGET
jgi:hypothetical protein